MLTNPSFNEVVNGERGMLSGIRACMDAKCLVSTVSLIYATIDALSALTIPIGKSRSTRTDFKKWVKQYLLQHLSQSISEHDVYAARCGVLHAYSVHSQDSRNGVARTIIYKWRIGHRPDDHILQRESQVAHVVELEALYEALELAVNDFHQKLSADPELNRRVSHHIAYLLCYKPWTPIALAAAA